MAGGAEFLSNTSCQVKKYEGGITVFVVITCIVAATGGLIFGYDIGISGTKEFLLLLLLHAHNSPPQLFLFFTGGVTSMPPFLKKFFPQVFRKEISSKHNDYCKFDSEILTLFTSSLYIAGMVSSLSASFITRAFGRKVSMVTGGFTFLVGAAMDGAAVNVAMLVVGRIMLGFGVGFTNQSVPIYLSEMAPPKIRGALTIGFQLCLAIGVLTASLINYGTAKIPNWGWRLSLGLGTVPALIMLAGSLTLTETPNSLIQRGQRERGKAMLQRIRGTPNVQEELDDLIQAGELSNKVQHDHSFRNILRRKYRPQLVMAVLIPFFQQITGINVIAFYGPVMFETIGFGSDAALMSAVILGIVNLISIVVSIFVVDKYGRRPLLLQGGIQMLISQVIMSAILADKLEGDGGLSKGYSVFVVVVLCMFAAGFGWSWGPLGWLVPSEIFPLEIRSAGQSITVAVNLITSFIFAQVFLSMLCYFKYGIFLFYAAWVVLMTLFVYFFLPETKNVPIEEMTR
ncbi:hypothetical protein KI387_033144, partial [Taxus chinensis]